MKLTKNNIKKGYTVEDFTTVAQVDNMLSRHRRRRRDLIDENPQPNDFGRRMDNLNLEQKALLLRKCELVEKGYTVEDFTDEKQVDRMLRRSEARLEELESQTPVDAKRVAANYLEQDALWNRKYELHYERHEKGN